MQLLIISATAAVDAQFIESIKTYKFRNEVRLLDDIDAGTLQMITANAYACIGPAPLHTDLVPLLNALQCGVPVIAGHTNHAVELLKNAALYVDAAQPEDIAEKMMLLYKDENKRDELIKKGLQCLADLNRGKTATQLWQNIQAVQV